jgi:hypothetical protein
MVLGQKLCERASFILCDSGANIGFGDVCMCELLVGASGMSCAIVMMPRINQETVLGTKLNVRRADDGGRDEETVTNLMTDYLRWPPNATDLLGLGAAHGDGMEMLGKRLDGPTATLQSRRGR